MRRAHSAARLLITGASGYLGRRLMQAAAGRGWEVYGTYHDLVAALLELAVRPDITGPMNPAGPQPLSRWDFGMKLLAALSVTLSPNVVPGTVLESGLIRSRNPILLSARASQLLETRLRSVDQVLACLPNDPPPSGDSVVEEGEMPAADEGRSRRPRYYEG